MGAPFLPILNFRVGGPSGTVLRTKDPRSRWRLRLAVESQIHHARVLAALAAFAADAQDQGNDP